MRKKVCQTLLLLLLLCALSGSYLATATSPATATLTVEEAGENGAFPAQVVISGNPGLAAWTFSVSWDPSAFSLVSDSIEVGREFSDGQLLAKTRDPGLIRVTWYNLSDVKEDGTLFTFELTPLDTAAQKEYTISLACSAENTINVQEQEVPVDTVNATVKASASHPSSPGSGVSSRPTVTAPQTPFSDVPADSYCYDAVQWAVTDNITKGTSKHLFSPGLVCTRGQLVTFLWRAADTPTNHAQTDAFTDVSPDDYFYNAVKWAAEAGIAKGTGQGAFNPEQPVTRAQAVTFLWRLAGAPEMMLQPCPFKDVPPDSYYTDAVCWAAELGITQGTSATTFSPDKTCTRGEIVTLLYRYERER